MDKAYNDADGIVNEKLNDSYGRGGDDAEILEFTDAYDLDEAFDARAARQRDKSGIMKKAVEKEATAGDIADLVEKVKGSDLSDDDYRAFVSEMQDPRMRKLDKWLAEALQKRAAK